MVAYHQFALEICQLVVADGNRTVFYSPPGPSFLGLEDSGNGSTEVLAEFVSFIFTTSLNVCIEYAPFKLFPYGKVFVDRR